MIPIIRYQTLAMHQFYENISIVALSKCKIQNSSHSKAQKSSHTCLNNSTCLYFPKFDSMSSKSSLKGLKSVNFHKEKKEQRKAVGNFHQADARSYGISLHTPPLPAIALTHICLSVFQNSSEIF